jgi:hypothetical protein
MAARRKLKRVRERGGASFICPKCGEISRVTRTTRHNKTVVRERRCLECDHLFATKEVKMVA